MLWLSFGGCLILAIVFYAIAGAITNKHPGFGFVASLLSLICIACMFASSVSACIATIAAFIDYIKA